jgi:hypothetical protein
MHFSTLPIPAQWIEPAFAIFVISDMRPVELVKIARRLCLNDSHTRAFGYGQNGRRL